MFAAANGDAETAFALLPHCDASLRDFLGNDARAVSVLTERPEVANLLDARESSMSILASLMEKSRESPKTSAKAKRPMQ